MTTVDRSRLPEERLNRRVRVLAWTTIAYNTVEGVVAIGAGLAAGSVALIGFGLDSGVEVLSALAVSWQFSRGADPRARERVALRLIAVSFLALAAYVAGDAVFSLVGGSEAESSSVGIVLAASSLVVMPILARAKRRVGRELGSVTVHADATQTELCTYLSAVLLGGLLLNATLGWSWADPFAALVIAAVALREGVQAWRGEGCCRPVAAPAAGPACGGCCAPPSGAQRALEVIEVRTHPGQEV